MVKKVIGTAAGVKHDLGKIRTGLVMMDFARALTAVSEVGTFGAVKYTEHGWIDVPEGYKRYTDAMFRHLMAEGRGEYYDRESEIAHAAHTAWNALARLDLALRSLEEPQ